MGSYKNIPSADLFDPAVSVTGDWSVPRRPSVIQARYQVFGLSTLGVVCCAAAAISATWNSEPNPGRWFWLTAGTAAGVVCLIRAQRVHGGAGADRDASPYYGIFAGVISGALLVTVLTVDVWILTAIFLAMATVLAFMAWIEQSAIGMTTALSVSVLAIGSGLSSLHDTFWVAVGSLSVGVMLLVAAAVMGMMHTGHGAT